MRHIDRVDDERLEWGDGVKSRRQICPRLRDWEICIRDQIERPSWSDLWGRLLCSVNTTGSLNRVRGRKRVGGLLEANFPLLRVKENVCTKTETTEVRVVSLRELFVLVHSSVTTDNQYKRLVGPFEPVQEDSRFTRRDLGSQSRDPSLPGRTTWGIQSSTVVWTFDEGVST